MFRAKPGQFQFMIGKYRVSVGFTQFHYSENYHLPPHKEGLDIKATTVEVAILEGEEKTFVTKKFFKTLHGNEDVAMYVTSEEFEKGLLKILKRTKKDRTQSQNTNET